MLPIRYKEALFAMQDQAKAAEAMLITGDRTAMESNLREAQRRMSQHPEECQAITRMLLNSTDDSLNILTLTEDRLATELGLEEFLPHTLPSLQLEAFLIYGYNPSQTYDIAITLYELKLISYPRTDCPYLPSSQYAQALEMITQINAARGFKTPAQTAGPAWCDNKISEHHGIIPLPAAAHVLYSFGADSAMRNVYRLICVRFEDLFTRPAFSDRLPARRYGDCDCECHREPGVVHAGRCCTLD